MDFVTDWTCGGLFPLSSELTADDRIENRAG
jgi:hypothetical protein